MMNNTWKLAQKMRAAGWHIIPLNLEKKLPIWKNWPERGVNTADGIQELADKYPRNNYGMFRPDAAVLDLDLRKKKGATLKTELAQLHKELGKFDAEFMQKTGSGGYHIPFYTHDYDIHTQQLTEVTEIKGWHSQVVGAGSIHPESKKEYTIYQGEPNELTELSDDALKSLARSNVEYEPVQVVMPDDGDEHPPCIMFLLEQGAPSSKSKKELTYNGANLLLVNYAIARGYSDAQATHLAYEMAQHTDPSHPTAKNVNDKVLNFKSALWTARRSPEKYGFECSYARRSPSIKERGCVDSCPNACSYIRKPRPIPKESVAAGDYSIEKLLKVNRKYLHIYEDYNVTIVPVTLIANRLPADVDIVIIVGASGSLKTEVIREPGEDENQYIYPISTITEHTLASGLVDNEDLAPRLRGRTLIIKDLTSILSKRDEVIGQILADIRELTDGYIQKEFGSGAKKRHNNIHSSVLAAATGAIERFLILFNELGSRMLLARPVNDPVEARRRAWKNQDSNQIAEIRKELHTEMFGFIDQEIKRLGEHPDEYQHLSDADAEKIGVWCDSLAVLRCPIKRDRYGRVLTVPEPEFPTRLQNSICKLAQVNAFIYRRKPDDNDLDFARRLVYDNLPSLRMRILPYLTLEHTTAPKISSKAGMSRDAVYRALEDLVTLGVCEKQLGSDEADGNPDADARSSYYWLSNKKISDFVTDVVLPIDHQLKDFFSSKNDMFDAVKQENLPKPDNKDAGLLKYSHDEVKSIGMPPGGEHTYIDKIKSDLSQPSQGGGGVPIVSEPLPATPDEWARRFGATLGTLKIADKLKGLTRKQCLDAVCIDIADEHCIHLDDVKQAMSEVRDHPDIIWNLKNIDDSQDRRDFQFGAGSERFKKLEN